jgi:hypothetical protein
MVTANLAAGLTTSLAIVADECSCEGDREYR